jgi:hypothetical protein
MITEHLLEFEVEGQEVSDTQQSSEATQATQNLEYCFDVDELVYDPFCPRIRAPRPQYIKYVYLGPGSETRSLQLVCALTWVVQDILYVQAYRQFIVQGLAHNRVIGNTDLFEAVALQYTRFYINLISTNLITLWNWVVQQYRFVPTGSFTHTLLHIFLQHPIAITPHAELLLPQDNQQVLTLAIALGNHAINWVNSRVGSLRTRWENISHLSPWNIIQRIESQSGNITFPQGFGNIPQIWDAEAFM